MDVKLTAVLGDITKENVDAIVNAANSRLAGGGGVDGAIHRAAGPQLMAECDAIRARQGGCKTGSAVITGPGNLKVRHVMHAVGPVWQGGKQNEDTLLASAYQACLKLAEEHRLGSIAFPNISTGVYGFPKARAADIVVRLMTEFMPQAEFLREIRLVCFDGDNLALYEERLSRLAK